MASSAVDKLVRSAIELEENHLRQALEEGGLPTEAEGEAVHKALSDAREEFERIVWRVEGIAKAEGDMDDLPDVSLEQLGVLAVLSDDVKMVAADLAEENERLQNAMSSLIGVRAQQQFKRERPS